jgi:predicted Zn-dependent protease
MRRTALALAWGIVFLVPLEGRGAGTPLDEGATLLNNQKYDEAIQVLQQYLEKNPKSAPGFLLLAQAYHWKKDTAKARIHYQKAAELDPASKLAIVPLLDEVGDWKEIIALLDPEVRKRNRAPNLLGPLATAYKQLRKDDEAEKVIKLLMATDYGSQEETDYKNYVLAYYHLWHKDLARSKERLRAIRSQALLRYAAYSRKFEQLFSDPEFIRLTGRKEKEK